MSAANRTIEAVTPRRTIAETISDRGTRRKSDIEDRFDESS
ncbi:hypothetical protein ACFJIW_13440 [Tahibacter sp. UC22_41]